MRSTVRGCFVSDQREHPQMRAFSLFGWRPCRLRNERLNTCPPQVSRHNSFGSPLPRSATVKYVTRNEYVTPASQRLTCVNPAHPRAQCDVIRCLVFTHISPAGAATLLSILALAE